MALTGAGLKAEIKANLIATGHVVDDAYFDDAIGAIADAIITYLVANTVVNAGQTVTTPDTINGTTTTPGTIS